MMKKKNVVLWGLMCVFLIALCFFWLFNQRSKNSENVLAARATPQVVKQKQYGLTLEDYMVKKGSVKKNQFLADLFVDNGVSYEIMQSFIEKADTLVRVNRIRVGDAYTLFFRKDSTLKAFVLEPNIRSYVMGYFDSTGCDKVVKVEKEIKVKEEVFSGVIKSSLYETFESQGVSIELALKMAQVYAWQIDFYRLQKGDYFKVYYQQRFIENKLFDIGRIIAVNFYHGGKAFNIYQFNQDGKLGYYNQDGEGVKSAFLRSPLEFGRLTSGYKRRRFHPVQKRFKAHLGTDYAAPKGTPILATGNGRVIASSYRAYNGNYVKIRHNKTYTTQYLHMSKRAVKVGQVVQQGDVIGYVGSTGLATGPHVCYRFWKNGKQVNHLKEVFKSSDPIKQENMSTFEKNKNEYQVVLDEEKLPWSLKEVEVDSQLSMRHKSK